MDGGNRITYNEGEDLIQHVRCGMRRQLRVHYKLDTTLSTLTHSSINKDDQTEQKLQSDLCFSESNIDDDDDDYDTKDKSQYYN